MPRGPVAVRLRTDVESHADALAGVVAGAAHLRQLPAGAHVAGAHLRVRLEAAGRHHDGARLEALEAVGAARLHAAHGAGVVHDQPDGLRAVAHLDAVVGGGVEQRVRQPLAGADGLDDEAAPEAQLALHLVGLAPVHQHPAHIEAVAHPAHRLEGAAHQVVGQLLVGEALADAHQVFAHIGLGVGADLDAFDLAVAEVGDECADVVDAVVGEAEAAAGEVGVAAAFVLAGLLEHEHARARFLRRQRSAKRRVSSANDHHVVHAAPSRSRALGAASSMLPPGRVGAGVAGGCGAAARRPQWTFQVSVRWNGEALANRDRPRAGGPAARGPRGGVRGRRASGATHADGDRHADADSHAHADSDGHADSHAHVHSHAHAHSDTYAADRSDIYTDADGAAHTDADSRARTDAHSHAHADGNGHAGADRDADGDAHSHAHGYTYADAHTHADSDRNHPSGGLDGAGPGRAGRALQRHGRRELADRHELADRPTDRRVARCHH